MKNDFNLTQPLPDIFPKSWSEKVLDPDFMGFRNLHHFISVVSKLEQKNDDNCGMSYQEALKKLMKGESDFPISEQMSIRNLVRSNLHKRGLITTETYEAYQYSVDGVNVGVDVGKYAAGEPDCVITPARQYIDFFYELYVSVSYPYTVKNKDVRTNTAKLLATIEELERRHIFIKISLILPVYQIMKNMSKNYFSAIPLFSHKDNKSVEIMSAVINDRLLRKFYFALFEDLYGEELSDNYGRAVTLDGCMNIGNEFNEIEFFEDVVKFVGA